LSAKTEIDITLEPNIDQQFDKLCGNRCNW